MQACRLWVPSSEVPRKGKEMGREDRDVGRIQGVRGDEGNGERGGG